MKIAYFSPLNPQKSGISDYSEALLPYLANEFEIDLWVAGFEPDNKNLGQFRIIDYVNNPHLKTILKDYDVIIYNIGNNPWFHATIYDTFLEYPGIVLLHDYILYYLITGYYLEMKKDRVAFIREFYYNYGHIGVDYAKEILRGGIPPLQFPEPERYPLVRRMVKVAKGIITHSETTRQLVISAGCPEHRAVKINQLNYENMDLQIDERQILTLKAKYGIGPNDMLLASFGYIAPTKRNLQVIDAVREVCTTSQVPLKYLMVGEGSYVDAYLDDTVKKTGYVSMAEFEKLLACTDIVINLRYPSMGETSATLLRAMMAQKPCIVSDHGWFSELPDSTVKKISIDPYAEKAELVAALLSLINNSEERSSLGRAGHDYVVQYHNASAIAHQIRLFAEAICSKTVPASGTTNNSETIETEYISHTSKVLQGLGIRKDQDYFIVKIAECIRDIF